MILIPTPQDAKKLTEENSKPDVENLIKKFKEKLQFWDGVSEIKIPISNKPFANKKFASLLEEQGWFVAPTKIKDYDMKGESWEAEGFSIKEKKQ